MHGTCTFDMYHVIHVILVTCDPLRLRRLQHESQQILQLARDSLLSIATQFIAHFANVRISEVVPQRGSSVSLGRKISYTPLLSGGPAKQERAKVTLDSGTISVSYLTYVLKMLTQIIVEA